MNKQLIAQAQQIAQEYELRVFPVSKEKRPVIKGWQERATQNPDQIAKLFAIRGAAGVGVPCGWDANDLMAFDVDLGHDPTPERLEKLQAWLEKHRRFIETHAQIHKTPSGGLHLIFLYPNDLHTKQPVARLPRNIMPKLEVIGSGFYFIWPTKGSGYEVIQRKDGWVEPDPAMLEVVERAGTGAGGYGLVSAEEAHEIMSSDGDAGERHKALLRMTHDWAEDHPDLPPVELCESFEQWFTDIYGDLIDEKRLAKLLQWDWDAGRKELTGELGRAFQGAYNTPERSAQELADALSILSNEEKALLPPAASRTFAAPSKPVVVTEEALIGPDDDAEKLPDFDWLIPGLLERGKIMGLTGTSNAGKTRWLSLFTTCAAAGDFSPLGMEGIENTDPLKVMLVANEESSVDLKRRIKATSMANGLRRVEDIVLCGQGWLDDRPFTRLLHSKDQRTLEIHEPTVKAVIQRAKETRAQIVTFDPYVTLGVNNENAAFDNNEMFAVFRRIAKETGAAVVFIHHAGKGESRTESPDAVRGLMSAYRGSSAITSAMDVGFTLLPFMVEEIAKSRDLRIRAMEMVKRRQLDNYVVMDWCKVREGRMGPASFYKIIPHTLPEGFDVGVMVLADEETARLDQRQKVVGGNAASGGTQVDVATMVDVIAEAFKDGDRLSLSALHNVMRPRQVAGWPTRTKAPNATETPEVIEAMNTLCGGAFEARNGKTVCIVKVSDGRTRMGQWRVKFS